MAYRYNALEQRVLKSGPTPRVPGGVRYYVHDEQGHLIGEYDQATHPVFEVVYLNDTPVAVITQTRSGSGTTLNVQTQVADVYSDHLDTPRVITRHTDQAVLWRWDQAEAFGNSPPNDNPTGLGVFSFPLRFPGQVFDVESGLVYNHHRQYDPAVGRYIQSDPIGLAGGINTFAYVGSAPTMFSDPLGLTTPSRPMPKGSELQQCPDPCPIIHKAIEDLVASLKTNWNAMYFDTKLYDNAYSIPNLNVTGTKTTWVGHLDNFYSVQRALKSQIANANRFNCPVSPEAMQWSNVLPPIRPGSSFGPMP